MSEGIPYADILILALIAGFILLRLRNALGHKSGDDQDFLKHLHPMANPKEPIVRLTDKPKSRPKEGADIYMTSVSDAAVVAAVDAIKAKDTHFTATQFLDGAKAAFEMVFDAFAKGDKPALKALMAEGPYQDFSAEIDARAAQDQRTETTLVAVTAKDLARASLDGNQARLVVKFTSEQIVVVRDKEGKIVEGDASEIRHVEDEWTFERDVTSKNPNWKIVEL